MNSLKFEFQLQKLMNSLHIDQHGGLHSYWEHLHAILVISDFTSKHYLKDFASFTIFMGNAKHVSQKYDYWEYRWNIYCKVMLMWKLCNMFSRNIVK